MTIPAARGSHSMTRTALLLWRYDSFGDLRRYSARKPSWRQITETVWDNPTLGYSLCFSEHPDAPKTTNRGMLAFCHFVFSRKNGYKADLFLENLILGEGDYRRGDPLASGLEPGSPVMSLLTCLRSIRNSGGRPGPDDEAAMIFCAWDGFRRGWEEMEIRPDGRPLKDYI